MSLKASVLILALRQAFLTLAWNRKNRPKNKQKSIKILFPGNEE